jgi:hypothetical protein
MPTTLIITDNEVKTTIFEVITDKVHQLETKNLFDFSLLLERTSMFKAQTGTHVGNFVYFKGMVS